MFDPSQQLPDFQTQSAEIERQRQMADMLRKQANKPMPTGQMAGKFYVKPSFTQYLGPLLQQWQAGQADQQTADLTSKYNQGVNTAQQQWLSSLPQAIAGRKELPGPPAVGGSPELADTPAVLPDRGSVLKATLAGMQIPGNDKAAQLWNQGMSADIQREDTQQQQRELRADQISAARQNKLDQLEFQRQQLTAQMEDKRLTHEQLAQYQKMHDTTLRAIAAEAASARRDAAAAATTAHADARQQAEDDKKEVRKSTLIEHLSRRAEPIVPMVNTAQQVTNMLDSYKDPQTGKTGDVPGLGFGIGALPLVSLSPEGSRNRQKIQMFANSMIRAQAGLSQTLSETERANLELLASGKYTQRQFTDAWPALLEKVNSTTKAIHGGYEPDIVKTFNERGGGLELVGSRAKPQTSGKFTIEVAQ